MGLQTRLKLELTATHITDKLCSLPATRNTWMNVHAYGTHAPSIHFVTLCLRHAVSLKVRVKVIEFGAHS